MSDVNLTELEEGCFYYKLSLKELETTEMKAERELNENLKSLKEAIDTLRKRVLAVEGLKSQLDDEFLVRFLRARKFNCDRALNLLKNYYKLRSDNPRVFMDFYPSSMKDIFKENMQGFLPDLDPAGRAIFVFRAGRWDASKYTPDDVYRANTLCMEKIIEHPSIQVNGIIQLVDMEGFRFNHVRHVTPNYIRRMVLLFQDCFPARFKAFHVVHESLLSDALIHIGKLMLVKKLRERIHLHGCNMSSLHKFIPKDILPSEFGGTQGPFDNHAWVQCLFSSDMYFQHRQKYGYHSK